MDGAPEDGPLFNLDDHLKFDQSIARQGAYGDGGANVAARLRRRIFDKEIRGAVDDLWRAEIRKPRRGRRHSR